MATTTDSIGRVLAGRYRIESALGSGASATVYAAWDVVLQRRVAIKVLHPGLAGDGSFLRRFRYEAQSAAALTHPHVLAVYDWGEDDPGPFLVLEYLGGGSLRDLLDNGRAWSVPGRGRGPGGRGPRLRPRPRLRPPRHQARQPRLRRGRTPAGRRLRTGPGPGRGGPDRTGRGHGGHGPLRRARTGPRPPRRRPGRRLLAGPRPLRSGHRCRPLHRRHHRSRPSWPASGPAPRPRRPRSAGRGSTRRPPPTSTTASTPPPSARLTELADPARPRLPLAGAGGAGVVCPGRGPARPDRTEHGMVRPPPRDADARPGRRGPRRHGHGHRRGRRRRAPPPQRRRRRRRWPWIVSIVVLVLALAAAGGAYCRLTEAKSPLTPTHRLPVHHRPHPAPGPRQLHPDHFHVASPATRPRSPRRRARSSARRRRREDAEAGEHRLGDRLLRPSHRARPSLATVTGDCPAVTRPLSPPHLETACTDANSTTVTTGHRHLLDPHRPRHRVLHRPVTVSSGPPSRDHPLAHRLRPAPGPPPRSRPWACGAKCTQPVQLHRAER